MANAVVPQADLGALTLHSLSSFSSLLAIFSGDNVAPTAMIQMESLGSMFLTSGKYADQIPGLLQRYTSVRLDRLTLSVGWRKNDSASIMALSAGGQAISLLSVVLGSIFPDASLGDILKELSGRLLPSEACLASMSQMVAVALILEKKAASVGFGNHLAFQTLQIHKMYNHLSKEAPSNLLDPINSTMMVDLLERISRAVREPHTILRISGTCGAGYVASVITMVFPHDSLITLDRIVVFEGIRKPCSIVLELGESNERLLATELEILLNHKDGLHIPIDNTCDREHLPKYMYLGHLLAFKWNGYLLDTLTFEFLRYKIKNAQGVLQACCDLVHSLILTSSWRDGLVNPSWNDPQGAKPVKVTKSTRKAKTIYRSLSNSLGSTAELRIWTCCQTLTGTVPSTPDIDVRSNYRKLQQIFTNITQEFRCQCNLDSGTLDPEIGFLVPKELTQEVSHENVWIRCSRCYLWMRVGLALSYLFWSLFIDVQSKHVALPLRPACTRASTTVTSDGSYSRAPWIARDYLDFINACLGFDTYVDKGIGSVSEVIHAAIGTLFCGPAGDHSRAIARGTGGQTVMPSTLFHLALRPGLPITYAIFDGSLVMQGNSYKNLICDRDEVGHGAESSDISVGSDIVPSAIGQHSNLQVTIREKLDHLVLRTVARVSGVDLEVDLRTAILRSHLVQQASPCQHNPRLPLDAEFRKNAKAVSVDLGSLKSTSLIWFSLTKGNPEAQLLCCRVANLLLGTDCCLNCSYELMQSHPEFERGKRQLVIL